MYKLLLYFQNTVIKEVTLHGGTVTVGRNPDNTICIDNQVVSGYHAKITDEGNQVFLEDLNSTNGTYVKGRKIDGCNLQDGDKIFIGKHYILFKEDHHAVADGAAEKTVALDMSKVRSMAAKESKLSEKGHFKVLSGNVDQSDYRLRDRATTIGKAKTADIRLKGLFAPKVVAMVNRSSMGYFLTPIGIDTSKVKVNGKPVSSRQKLEDGDLVDLYNISLQFYLSE